MRPLVHFFVLGALLLAAKRGVSSYVAPPPLVVAVAARATPVEVERAIDEAVLLEHALARGALLADPVVRDQLLVAMRLPSARGADDDADALIARALKLGLHRADPVVRQRLVRQAEQLLVATASEEAASDATLRAYLAAHAGRYAEPASASVEQVFLSLALHGTALAQAADALGSALRTAPDHAPSGDPTALPRRLESVSARTLDARFGPGFGAAAFVAPSDAWHGPIASSFGLHFVRVGGRRAAHTPPLDQVRARVLADYRHDRRDVLLRARLRSLRAQYQVQIARVRA